MSRVVLVTITADFRRLGRALEAAGDNFRLWTDAWVRRARREWDPDYAALLVDDDERAEIEARALGRTLAEIDELPEGRP